MAGIPGKGGQKGRSGPPGNANNAIHGGRADQRHGLQVGSLPTRYRDIQRSLSRLRRRLEGAVAAAKGTVSVTDAQLIVTFLRWTQVSMIIQRLMMKSADDTEPAQQVAYATQIAEASEKSDRAMKALGLAGTATAAGGSGEDEWDAAMRELRQRDAATPNLFSPTGAPNASGANLVAQEGDAE